MCTIGIANPCKGTCFAHIFLTKHVNMFVVTWKCVWASEISLKNIQVVLQKTISLGKDGMNGRKHVWMWTSNIQSSKCQRKWSLRVM